MAVRNPTTLWIVCPVYRDVPAFLALRRELLLDLDGVPFAAPRRTRFVVVDDSGGEDDEVGGLRGLPDVEVVPTPFNLGHQGAIVFGLRWWSRRIEADDWVVTMDADGEDRPVDLPRLLDVLAERPPESLHVVLAQRTKRRASWRFKLLYAAFKVLFRILTGTVVRTGNYAAFAGSFVQHMLGHPHFDLSYSSTLLTLKVPKTFLPCERGCRYVGESRMDFSALLRHGLGMMMPFTDVVALRALIAFAALFAGGLFGVGVVLGLRAGGWWSIPAWAWYVLLSIVTLSVTALGNAVVLFFLFAQSQTVALRVLRQDHGLRAPVRLAEPSRHRVRIRSSLG